VPVQPNITPDINAGRQVFRPRGQSNLLYPAIDPEECTTLKNMNLTVRGTARTRRGYDEFNPDQITELTVEKDITGLDQVKIGGTTYQVEFAGTKVYEDDGTTRTDREGGTLSLTDNADLRWRGVQAGRSYVATNGTDEVVRGTGGATFTDLTASSNIDFTTCRDLVMHKNTLIALRPTIGGTDEETMVRWCDINTQTGVLDITNFPQDNVFEVYYGGAPIIGGVDAWEFLYVVKEDGIYKTQLQYDTGYIELTLVSTIQGFKPLATHSIKMRAGQPSFIHVIAEDGAYVVTPDDQYFRYTEKLQDDWEDLNEDRLQYAVSSIRRSDKQIRTLLSSGTNTSGHDRVLVYRWDTGDVWFDELEDKVNYADSWTLDGTEFDIYGTTDGYVHKGNDATKTTDNGGEIDFTLAMGPNDLGYPGRKKRIIYFRTIYRRVQSQQNIALAVRLDQGNTLQKSKTLDLEYALQYDEGNKYDSGLKYPGGPDSFDNFFVNKNAETVEPIWTGSTDAEIIGYSCDFSVLE
jgi:hypothetical protein